MKNLFFRISLVLLVLSLLGLGIRFLPFAASAASIPVHKTLVDTTSEWSLETSGTTESITKSTNGWTVKAGGIAASTHYARLKYKLPEKVSQVFTTFYLKSTIDLPSDFYTNHEAGFRIMNTDNFGVTLNGTPVGAVGTDELRTAVYMNSDHTIRVNSSHENHTTKEFYNGQQLPTGPHTLELFGDVANVAPWWFKIDGVTVASGVDRLSPDTVPSSERVITRLIAGIDGAADQDTKSMSYLVKNIEFANYDPSSSTSVATPTTAPSGLQCPPGGTGSNGNATMSFSLDSTANYKLWVHMMSAGDAANSLWAKLDNLYCVKVGDLSGMATSAWTWVDYQNGSVQNKIPMPLLSQGTHTIQLFGNAAEPGVKVSHILLTKDISCLPTSEGDNCLGIISTPTPTTHALVPTPTGIDTTPPTIRYFNIPNGYKLPGGGSKQIIVKANDTSGIGKIDILTDGTLGKTCTNTGDCTYTWSMTRLAKGTHTIMVKVWDKASTPLITEKSVLVYR